ncbi:hypothetical protein RHMOL_Rhmol08G0166500 [Rhododendron molle]|uniref:Uncharacterized protein n=1 Tax=Rhododendron molle TaxID=49168 RepID=A0ACC0MP75_RHOML|nr:hypothetical protein RHMOL_Rhmol08G0166500 [Rhododendron molle]
MLSGLNARTIVNLTRDSDALERATDYYFCPQEYIIEEFFSKPVVQIPDEPNICVLDPEDLWGKSELVNVWMDGEEPITKSDPAKKWRNHARSHAIEMKSKGKEPLYQGEPEPFVDIETKKKYPGFEIFANDTWESDEEVPKVEELSEALDWLEAFGLGSLQLLFEGEDPEGMVEDAAVLALGDEEEIEDPSKLIVEAIGTYDNCTFIPHVTRTHSTCTEVRSLEVRVRVRH